MYETFEHTADLGLRIRAGDVNGLFEEAARALFSVLTADLEAVRPVETLTVSIAGTGLTVGTGREDLLYDWLAELLYIFDARHMLLVAFDVYVDRSGLTATVRGEPIDPARHEIDTEIKAITYHQLKVEPEGDGWLAEVIVDL